MDREFVKQYIAGQLDKYAALEGRPRSQTARAAIAISVAEALLQSRRARASARQASATEIPATWREMRIRRGGWNGACRHCRGQGLPGQKVAWDPDSGRPSQWQHISCADPYGEGGKPERNGQPRLFGRRR